MDFEEEAVEIDPKVLKGVAEMVQTYAKIMSDILAHEVKLKELKKEFELLSTVKIPDAFDQMGLEELKLKDGSKIQIKKDVYVSIPKDKKFAAFAWLRKQGHGTMIKQEVKANFGKGEEKKVKTFLNLFNSRKSLKDVDVNKLETIHHQTLKAFGRDMLEQGVDLPEACFSIHHGKSTIIQAPKKRKVKKNG